ncbi:MAG: DNA helicase RecG, partial [Myxococcota bacterium]
VTRGSSSDDAWRRLNVMVKTNDGFQIAEEDLEIRGPGDFIGTRQSGLPLLSFANLARDQRVLEMAREDAADLLARDPKLEAPEHRALAAAFKRSWSERLELAQIG